jgi:tetratricopeptide (TPR) repeat protein
MQMTATDHLNSGIHYFVNKKFEKAIKEFSKALKIDKDDIDALYFRGVSYSELDYGFEDEAIDDLDRVIEDIEKTGNNAQPHLDAYIYRADVLFEMGYLEKALVDSNKACELFPDSHRAIKDRSMIKLDLGDYKGARVDMLRAEELNTFYASNPK